jgi:hypothetical protein
MAQVLHGKLFYGAHGAIAGVVDQHIDGAELLQGSLHRRLYLPGVGYIHHQAQAVALVLFGEEFRLFALAESGCYFIAFGQDGVGKRLSKARGRAGEEPDLCHSSILIANGSVDEL